MVDVVHLDPARFEQLLEIFVLADHADEQVGVRRLELVRHRGDHIVGFVALAPDDRDAEFFEHREAPFDLRLEVLGRRITVDLVVGVQLRAERPGVTRNIERHRDVRRRARPLRASWAPARA